MAPDLTPLERAAERVGLPGLRARVVPPDPRRGAWFRWDVRSGDLTVSERVIERCVPADAAALLTCEVLLAKRLKQGRVRLLRGALIVTALAWVGVAVAAGAVDLVPGFHLGVALLLPLLLFMMFVGERTREAIHADDETVRLLGDAEPLVRGLNCMNQDEAVFAGWRTAARPDLHHRAERLVRLHHLCAAPSGQGPSNGPAADA